MNPAGPNDLIERWRPLSDAETLNGVVLLDDAWRMLCRRADALLPAGETLSGRVTADADLCAEVVRVMCTAVLRVMKNPDGKRQESIDDYSWTRDQAVSAGLLYFSDDELSDILPGLVSSGAYTIDPLAGRDWSDWS